MVEGQELCWTDADAHLGGGGVTVDWRTVVVAVAAGAAEIEADCVGLAVGAGLVGVAEAGASVWMSCATERVPVAVATFVVAGGRVAVNTGAV